MPESPGRDPVPWQVLPRAAKAFRVAHATWAAVSLTALGYIWMAGIKGRRDRLLAASIGWLGIEGGALVIGRGDCPFGPLQARLGDPVPLFELVLPPRMAKAAVPGLTIFALVGITLATVVSPRRRSGQP